MALPVRVTALGEQDGGERERGEPDRDVDEEDPLPGEDVGEDAAEEHARGCAEATHGAPGTQGDVALPALAERRGQDRERGRRDRGGAQSLQRASGDQRRLAPGEAAEERADREDDQAGHEDHAAPEDVGETTAQQQKAAEDERIRADHPLQVLLREAQVFLDGRQRDVDDRDVQNDDELRDAEERQCKPFHTCRSDHVRETPLPFLSKRRH